MGTTPEQLLPEAGAIARLRSFVFNWEPVDAGGPYVLEVASDEDFEDVVAHVTTSLTQAEATFEAGREYFWRVSADGVFSGASRRFTAAPFDPAIIETHVEDGKGRMLNQFKENS